MKRIGYLHEQIYEPFNIEIADNNARRHKKTRWGIIKHDRKRNIENEALSDNIKKLIYKTSEYSTFKVFEPKERLIFRLSYYPDRIAHHAIMNIMEPIWTKLFIAHTYSCIKNRGIHKVNFNLRNALYKYPNDTKYCLKLDIKKFYPSLDHSILKGIIRKKIKDRNTLILLDEIIDSTSGVPIGNYLSQFFANLYLTYFDHWLKEEVKCKFYFRYADDIVILHHDKNELRKILILIKLYLKEIKLEVKDNYQIFPVESRGIDFVGYKFYHTHILLRKSIKNNLLSLINKYKNHKIKFKELKVRLQSYFGWLKYCNSKNLLRKIQNETGIKFSNWNGKKVSIKQLSNKTVYVVNITDYSKSFRIEFVYKNKSCYTISNNYYIYEFLKNCELPINYKFKNYEVTNTSN